MHDFGGIAGGFAGSLPGSGMDRLLMAETLGLVMARRAAQILDRHRESLTPDTRPASLDGAAIDGAAIDGAAIDGAAIDGASLDGAALDGASLDGGDVDRFALDDAIFTAVLDATNECLGRFDSRPPADRWCDALLHLLDLARYEEED